MSSQWSAVGLGIDDEVIRVATGHLHLGVPLFSPYLCLQWRSG